MKARALILAATIAATAGSLTTATAQACGINDDGSCISSVVWTQPPAGNATHQPTKPTTHPRRQVKPQAAPVRSKVPTSIGSWIEPQAAPVRSKVPTSIGSWIEPH
jgi:hypothetical protein